MQSNIPILRPSRGLKHDDESDRGLAKSNRERTLVNSVGRMETSRLALSGPPCWISNARQTERPFSVQSRHANFLLLCIPCVSCILFLLLVGRRCLTRGADGLTGRRVSALLDHAQSVCE
ncbi:hypothetical protein OBBRIDRAFT_405303 [Obba rivulosa]|uniref:Uncharacterized protein n=1 Tax=Obba rivulosa TaxID=1052685 RepID=A0A8E2AXP0_9APHY|nr:hypothetical protein OBBRIDRAFT_405303 [Obba rivulosa]